MDEVAIYAGKLDPARILAHYQAWQPRNCNEAISRGYQLDADLNGDCRVNFADFAELAANWIVCNTPGGTGCIKNW